MYYPSSRSTAWRNFAVAFLGSLNTSSADGLSFSGMNVAVFLFLLRNLVTGSFPCRTLFFIALS